MEVVLPNGSLFIRKSNLSTPKRRRFRLSAEIEEIRVCTNRTCRRQGSFQTLEILTSLAPANVAVKSSGCLGRCGSGPNLVALPGAVMVNHCGTAARAAEVMMALCKGDWDSDAAQKSLEALALRKKAESELEKGNFSEAEFLLSKAIELKQIGGMNIIYKDRAVARLAMDKYSEALEDIWTPLSSKFNQQKKNQIFGLIVVECEKHAYS
ncbi:hypothetical protein UlMin_044754 [Ulmus minor]